MKQQDVCVLPVAKILEYRRLLKSGKKWRADFVCESLEDLLMEMNIDLDEVDKRSQS